MKTKSKYKDDDVIYDLLVSDISLIAKEDLGIEHLTDEQISDIERAFKKIDLYDEVKNIIECALIKRRIRQ